MDVNKYKQKKYCIIIASHNPKEESLFDTLVKLANMNIYRIFLIDSSNHKTSGDIQLFINNLNNMSGKQNIFYQKIKNYGPGHKFNLGFDSCLLHGCDLITLLEDDVTIDVSKFYIQKIVEHFHDNLNADKDMLALALWDPRANGTLNEVGAAPDFGMTLSRNLINKIRFRDSLILDHVDIDICHRIRQNGGKIKLYPYSVMTSTPDGARTSKDVPHRPPWRIYLIVRNYLILSKEYKDIPFFINSTFFNIGEMLKSYKAGEKLSDVFRAAFLGFVDSVRGRLGNTESLKFLSGNIFCDDNERS